MLENKQVKGEIKETAGQLLDNPKLEEEGQEEKIAGKVQEKTGQIKKVFGKQSFSIAGRERGVKYMELKEVKCKQCGKGIYVDENYLREKMFCTLGCLGAYNESPLKNNRFH